jgi:hypothetical protein
MSEPPLAQSLLQLAAQRQEQSNLFREINAQHSTCEAVRAGERRKGAQRKTSLVASWFMARFLASEWQ